MKRIPSILLHIEAGFVFLLGAYMVVLGFTHDKSWLPYLSVTAFAFIGAVGLFFVARGISLDKRRAYSPAILANLIALGVAKYQFEGGFYFLAAPISAAALTIIACLLINLKRGL